MIDLDKQIIILNRLISHRSIGIDRKANTLLLQDFMYDKDGNKIRTETYRVQISKEPVEVIEHEQKK